jgi:flagellar protein FliL
MATLAPPVPTEAPPAPAAAKGGRKKLVVVIAVLVVAAGAAWTFLKPSPEASATEAPKPGPVVQLEPLTLNLADGHYLKLGLALQVTEAVAE